MAKQNQVRTDQAEGARKQAEREAQEFKEHNLRFYAKGCEVPEDALKKIKAGRLTGMSDVNPMWRMKRMTEIFGPVGFGWRYEIERQWTETYGAEVKCFCNVLLFVRDPETKEWSAPIPGNGGSAIVSKEKSGPYVNDEAYKMALTDALSIAMKPLGIGGNIWYGPKATGHNESKYEEGTRDVQSEEKTSQPKVNKAGTMTGEILNRAVSEINSAKNQEEFTDIWNKWACEYPADCINGTPFWNAAALKGQQLTKNTR